MHREISHKTTTGRVSIVITCFNYGQFVAQAIESALNQSAKHVEVIVVNDGSTDNSDSVISTFVPQITYIKHDNQGVVAARNNGAKKASGEFLVFLDADDYLPEDYVEIAVEAMAKNPSAAVVYGDIEVVGARSYRMSGDIWNENTLLVRNYIGLTSMLKRDVFEEIEGFKSEFNAKKSYEDWELWLNLIKHGYKGYYCPELYFYYRKLNINNRNKATLPQKIALRWPLVQLHWRLYLSYTFLFSLPFVLVKALLHKAAVLSK